MCSLKKSDEPDVDFREKLIGLVTECQNEDMLEYMYYFMLTKLTMNERKESLA